MSEPERHVTFDACFNFRDLGGYETVDGHRVRWGCTYRADNLYRLSPPEIDRLLGLGVRTIIDLRSSAEVTREGQFGQSHAVAFHHLPVFEEENLPFTRTERDDPPPPPGETYFAIAAACAPVFGTALRTIAEGDLAAVFHCAAGKDRTGILAALLLSTLGVPDEMIAADYALSERAVEPATRWARANDAEFARWLDNAPPWLLTSPASQMHALLDQLGAAYGSTAGFLVDAGVERDVVDALRARLLE